MTTERIIIIIINFVFSFLPQSVRVKVGLVSTNLRQSPEPDSCWPWLVRIKSFLKLPDRNVVSTNPSFRLQDIKKIKIKTDPGWQTGQAKNKK